MQQDPGISLSSRTFPRTIDRAQHDEHGEHQSAITHKRPLNNFEPACPVNSPVSDDHTIETYFPSPAVFAFMANVTGPRQHTIQQNLHDLNFYFSRWSCTIKFYNESRAIRACKSSVLTLRIYIIHASILHFSFHILNSFCTFSILFFILAQLFTLYY